MQQRDDDIWDRSARNETPEERADRNYNELLQELRVAQTGVQILFAFLLSLPFLQGFEIAADDRRMVYSITLLSAATSTLLLIAPVPFHRLVFRKHLKESLVRVANQLALAGAGFLLLAMTGALWLVFDSLWSRQSATVVAVVFAVVGLALWALWPLYRQSRVTDVR